jgi:hypothetical protein
MLDDIEASLDRRVRCLDGMSFRPRNRHRSRFRRSLDTAFGVPFLPNRRMYPSVTGTNPQVVSSEANEVENLIERSLLLDETLRLMRNYDGLSALGCSGEVFSSSRRSLDDI